MTGWESWPTWSHLATQDGLPVPIHSQSDPDNPGRWLFSTVDPHRQMFLTITQRCSICGHKYGGAVEDRAVVFANDAIQQFEQSPDVTVAIDGQVAVIDGRIPSQIQLPASEGAAHPGCIAMAATLCPFLGSTDYRYSTESASAEVAKYDEWVAAAAATRANLPASLRDLDVWDRVGEPSGRKWVVCPNWMTYIADNSAVGQAPTVAVLLTPATFRLVEPVADVAEPVVADLGDPVPGIVAGLSRWAAGSLLMVLDPGLERGRNDLCWCDSGRKSKRCHNLGLVPRVLLDELVGVFDKESPAYPHQTHRPGV